MSQSQNCDDDPRKELPQPGDKILVVRDFCDEDGEPEDYVESATVLSIVPGGVLHVEAGIGDRFFVDRREGENTEWEEVYYPCYWENSCFIDEVRDEVTPKVGERVEIAVDTCLEDGESGQLPLIGTIVSVDHTGATKIDIDSFQIVTGRDYWVNNERKWFQHHDYYPCDLFLNDGQQIN